MFISFEMKCEVSTLVSLPKSTFDQSLDFHIFISTVCLCVCFMVAETDFKAQ